MHVEITIDQDAICSGFKRCWDFIFQRIRSNTSAKNRLGCALSYCLIHTKRILRSLQVWQNLMRLILLASATCHVSAMLHLRLRLCLLILLEFPWAGCTSHDHKQECRKLMGSWGPPLQVVLYFILYRVHSMMREYVRIMSNCQTCREKTCEDMWQL